MSQRLYEGMSLREITEYLFVQDAPERADLIILFGGRHPDRAEKAANLYKEGYAPRLFITGGDPRRTGVTEAESLARICLELGVPAEAVTLETRSVTTLENVLMTVPLVDRIVGWKNMSAVILVSAPMHMRRVKQVVARHIPRDVKILCCPDDRTDISRDNWWTTEEGRKAVFRELEKLRTYSMQGEL